MKIEIKKNDIRNLHHKVEEWISNQSSMSMYYFSVNTICYDFNMEEISLDVYLEKYSEENIEYFPETNSIIVPHIVRYNYITEKTKWFDDTVDTELERIFELLKEYINYMRRKKDENLRRKHCISVNCEK